MKKLWGGRFSKELASETERFTQSIEVDSRMVLYDIWGSEAHAIMLARQEIISQDDLKEILKWLERAKEDFEKGKFKLKPELEDVHMNVEAYLIEGAGFELGGKLHTARSRNDQVLVDAKLYIREQILRTEELLCALAEEFIKVAKDHPDAVMPGYTHTQHAQPITLGFWATAYVSMFLRDLRRLRNAYEIVNTNPLGACALAGTSFPIDREFTTWLLGFDSTHEHALDVISSRDFIAETLCALAILSSNLSKLAEEIVYWSTYEFGMIELDDAYALGSSIMPQKKNPCVAELIRARTGRVYGALMDLLTVLKGLPMGYNRDLQEDKPPLWEAFDQVQSALSILTEMIPTTKFKTDRMEKLAGANFSTATELANYLVREHGLPFRRCHEIVGSVVGELARRGLTFSDLEQTQRLLEERGVVVSIEELRGVLDPRRAVESNRSLGGTSPREVMRMTDSLLAKLRDHEFSIKMRQDGIDQAYRRTKRIVEGVLEGEDLEGIIGELLSEEVGAEEG